LTDRVATNRRRRLWIRVHDSERQELKAIAEQLGEPSVASLIRTAVDNLVADFRTDDEPLVFDRRRTVQPVAHERRSSKGRRRYNVAANAKSDRLCGHAATSAAD
jgi:hypothetical protein